MHNPAHPGEVLKENYLEPLGLTVAEAADALGVEQGVLSSLIDAQSSISPEMALRLAKAFNTSERLWLNMQGNYDLWQARQHTDVSSVRVLISEAA